MIGELMIDPNTPEKSPTSRSYDVGRPIAKDIKVTIPTRHAGLAYLKVLSKGRLIMPDKGEQWIHGDNQTITLGHSVILEGPPFEITLVGYNLDDTYPHGFTVEVV